MAAATLPSALIAAKSAGAETAGAIRSIIAALDKPIYSDLKTTTVTHTTRSGDVVVRTSSKGWTIPLGLPVLVVGAVGAWEVGLALAKAFGVANGGNASDFQLAADILDPAMFLPLQIPEWIAGLLGAGKGAPATVSVPPTFMGSLSLTAQQMLVAPTLGLQALNSLIASLTPKGGGP